MFPHRVEVGRGLCVKIMNICMYVYICMHVCACTRERVEDSNWRAISTVSRREVWKDRGRGGGSCEET